MMNFDPDVALDYTTALIGGGIPSSYHLASAIARRDTEEALYYAKLEASVLGTQYTMLRFLNWYSPKNAMSFHHLHSGMSFVRQQALSRAALATAPALAVAGSVAAAVGYERTVNEPIREAHGGIRNLWFGPFASGFGTVV
jgi:hypothetical protein